MAHDPNTLFLLTGPTACGKTDFAIQWALYNNAEILSCDSLLFYQGMDIGTAKPTKEQLNKVPHHGIDLVAPSKPMDIKDYLAYAAGVIKDIHNRGKNVLIVGGSGFYLKGFYAPVMDGIEPSDDIILQVDALYETHGLKGLLLELDKFNPNGTGNLDRNNPRRVLKALQRCLATGKSYTDLYEEFRNQPHLFDSYNTLKMLIYRSRESLKERIIARVEIMLAEGLIDEVTQLLQSCPNILNNPSAANAIGYREVIQALDADKIDSVKDIIVKNTLLLKNKQIKWFRHNYRHEIAFNVD